MYVVLAVLVPFQMLVCTERLHGWHTTCTCTLYAYMHVFLTWHIIVLMYKYVYMICHVLPIYVYSHVGTSEETLPKLQWPTATQLGSLRAATSPSSRIVVSPWSKWRECSPTLPPLSLTPLLTSPVISLMTLRVR